MRMYTDISDGVLVIWSLILFIIIMYLVGWFSYEAGYSNGCEDQNKKIEEYKKVLIKERKAIKNGTYRD